MRGVVVGFIIVGVAQTGCGPKNGGSPPPVGVVVEQPPAPAELPPAPELKEPAAPPAQANGKDLGKLSAKELKAMATQAAARKDFKTAAAAEAWAVKAGDGDLYDLACYAAGAKDPDAALYWLVQAGSKQGVDLTKATTNPELKLVWEDPRYTDKVFPYLAKCSMYFAAHGPTADTLVTPAGYDRAKSTAVIVCLHGHGSRPEDFPGPDAMALANATKCPVVGVSGTVPLGPSRFIWANDATKDAKRIADAMKRFADRLAVSPGKVVLVGFDEGAQVALEVAVREGSTFAGAVILSPSAEVKLDPTVKPSEKSRFVLVMGTKETYNREVVKQDRQFLTATKAVHQYVEIPNGEHRLPADLLTTLPKWVEYVLDGK